jgi:hypothetical protein
MGVNLILPINQVFYDVRARNPFSLDSLANLHILLVENLGDGIIDRASGIYFDECYVIFSYFDSVLYLANHRNQKLPECFKGRINYMEELEETKLFEKRARYRIEFLKRNETLLFLSKSLPDLEKMSSALPRKRFTTFCWCCIKSLPMPKLKEF